TVTGGAGYTKSLEVSSAGVFALVNDFAYFEIFSTNNKNVAIDDLTFDAPAGPVLPRTRFESSQCGRVRVRINDGFNEAVAMSGCFTVAGAVPAVQIIEPAPGYRFAAGTPVFLSGQAYDEGSRALSGGQLVWSVEGRPVGQGESVFFDGFAQGTSRL